MRRRTDPTLNRVLTIQSAIFLFVTFEQTVHLTM